MLLAACTSPPIRFHANKDPNRPLVTSALGKPVPDQTTLTLGLPGHPPLLGEQTIAGSKIIFQPAFPLLPGQVYEARLRLPGQTVASTFYTHPAPTAKPPAITRIHPTTSALPANHLKFYLHFSQPMQRGDIFRYFRLSDSNGTNVPEPFRETELWSKDGRRLTLWLHPGRQKTGVNLNLDLGPVLLPGRSYTLEISGQWKSQAGKSLGKDILKNFRTHSAERAKLNPAKWKINATRDAVLIQFDKPLDWALLQTQVAIHLADGRPITGSIETLREETACRFVPRQPLAAGRYEAVIGWELEDLAGNNLQRPFEVDLTKIKHTNRALPARLSFTVD